MVPSLSLVDGEYMESETAFAQLAQTAPDGTGDDKQARCRRNEIEYRI